MMFPPAALRARAGLIASETGLLALAAGVQLAVSLLVALHGVDALPLVEPVAWVVCGLAGCGVVWLSLGRYLGTGVSEGDKGSLRTTWPPLMVASVLLLALCVIAVLMMSGDGHQGLSRQDQGGLSEHPSWLGLVVLWVASVPAVALIAFVSLRNIAIIERPPVTPIAELAQPTAHALLGGLAVVMLVGLSGGRINADLTYHLGAGISIAGAATILWTGWSLRGARLLLLDRRREHVGWPVAEHGYRTAAFATLFGLIIPSLVVLADLMTARLTGMILSCAALAVSQHAIRYAWVLLRCGIPEELTPVG